MSLRLLISTTLLAVAGMVLTVAKAAITAAEESVDVERLAEEPKPVEMIAQDEFDLEARRDTHWAWQAVKRPELPNVRDTSWPQGPIDRFVLAKLEATDMRPAERAEPLTLLRRLYFALTGLPPKPADVVAYLEDSSPAAYEQLVDHLLDSPRFGERWARHWLDLARYAETRGHEQNEDIQNAWRYRDYVIRAYNDDLPYDQFILEQIAGDQLPHPRRHSIEGFNESALGAGFFWLGDSIHSPVDLDAARADRIDNQLEVTFKTFQALTVNCARCHDHKLDAISQQDYYALYGVLQGSRFLARHIDDSRTHQKRIERLHTIRDRICTETSAAWKAKADDVSQYLSAARFLVFGGETLPHVPLGPDRKLDGFADTGFPNWQIEGEAFSHGPVSVSVVNTLLTAINPTNGPIITPGARGPVASSHPCGQLATKRRPAEFNIEGHRLTGTLTRKPFEVDRRYLHFLITGGEDERTALEVIVDGKVVRSATGRGLHLMRDERLDLTPWRGKMAVVRLVDRRSEGEHGYISVGELTLSDEPLPAVLRGEVVGSVLGLAEQRGLDPVLLSRWVEATIQQRHLLAEAAAASDRPSDGDTLVSLSWTFDGPAFVASPTSAGDIILGPSATHPLSVFLTSGWHHSGLTARRLTGSIQSSTFTLSRRYLHVRVMGDEARFNLRISDTQFSSPPIYEGLKKHIVSMEDTPQWMTIDVSMWQGRRAYLELTDHASLDPLDVFRFGRPYTESGAGGVEQVVLSSSVTPPGPSSEQQTVARQWNAETADTVETALARAIDGWAAGELSDADALLLQIVARHGLLDGESANGSDRVRNIAVLFTELKRLEAEIQPGRLALSMARGTGIDAMLHVRGEPSNLGHVVPRGFLTAIAGKYQPPITEGDGRLAIAHYLASAENPLTARVIVNRIWHHLLGRGLVPTVDNFGAMGEPPTHPELLDYLATRFIKLGWSQKRLIREIVLSKTFQMSSDAADRDFAMRDPQNRWLHRAHIRRLEGEAIRDAVMMVSGRLNLRMYGPSVRHIVTTSKKYQRDEPARTLDGDGRRSIYLKVDRNALPPWFVAFDGPKPSTTIGRRSISNLPAQSLTMMNSPYVMQQAAYWADRVADEPSATEASRITDLYLRAYARQPLASETAESQAFLQQQRIAYRDTSSGTSAERLAWRDLCHAVYNTKEFVFVR